MSNRIHSNRPSLPNIPAPEAGQVDAQTGAGAQVGVNQVSGPAAGEFEPVSPNDPRLQNTICPFMRSALKGGLIHVDGLGRAEVSQLREVLGPFGKVAEFFARQNHSVDENGQLKESSKDDGLLDFFRINPKSEYYNPLMLAGSKGDHVGDSKILTRDGGFDAERFEAFVSHSSDGKTMTAADFGRAVTSTQPLDPEVDGLGEKTFNKSKSAGEWSLLIHLLGKKDANGELRVDIQEMRDLFENNVFPEDWTARVNANGGKAPWRSWTKQTTKVLHSSLTSKPRDIQLNSTSDMAMESMRHIGSGGASLEGIGLALGQSDTPTTLVNSLEGARQGVCPVGGDPGVSATTSSDVQKLHNQS